MSSQIKVGDIFTVDVSEVGKRGDPITILPDGLVAIIPDCTFGENRKIRITERKSTYAMAEEIET